METTPSPSPVADLGGTEAIMVRLDTMMEYQQTSTTSIMLITCLLLFMVAYMVTRGRR